MWWWLIYLVLSLVHSHTTPCSAATATNRHVLKSSSRVIMPHEHMSRLAHIHVVDTQQYDPSSLHQAQLSATQLCHACHTAVVEFHRFILGSLGNEEWEGSLEMSALAALFCTEEPWAHFRTAYTQGCQLLVPLFPQLMEPWLNERKVGDIVTYPMSALVERKREQCVEHAHCPAGGLPSQNLINRRAKNDCQACESMTAMFAWMLEREADISDTGVEEWIFKYVCDELLFHVIRPAEVEYFCRSTLDDTDWRKPINRTMYIVANEEKTKYPDEIDPESAIQRIYRPMRQLICVQLTEACTSDKEEL